MGRGGLHGPSCCKTTARPGAPHISLTPQGDGFSPVDADGQPTGPANLWDVARVAVIVDRWRAAADPGLHRWLRS
jgi:sugar (pentulose or hexulose) kinase